MRPRLNVGTLVALSLLTGAYREPTPFGLPNDSRRRVDDPPGPSITDRDRLELDLYHAEAQLAGAATLGARRKASRKVEAIRARLGRTMLGSES